jgi:hypothetical protein
LFAIGSLFAVGCAETSKPTTQPSTVRERQDAALQDPFGYGGSTEKIDITGGGLTDFNKNSFKRDVDSVMNP